MVMVRLFAPGRSPEFDPQGQLVEGSFSSPPHATDLLEVALGLGWYLGGVKFTWIFFLPGLLGSGLSFV